jgi:hypothetical protein
VEAVTPEQLAEVGVRVMHGRTDTLWLVVLASGDRVNGYAFNATYEGARAMTESGWLLVGPVTAHTGRAVLAARIRDTGRRAVEPATEDLYLAVAIRRAGEHDPLRALGLIAKAARHLHRRGALTAERVARVRAAYGETVRGLWAHAGRT